MEDLALNNEEQAAVASLTARIMQDPSLASSVSAEMVVQFLMARKFEEDRAYELMLNSLQWRRERGIGIYLPINQTIISELKTGKIIIPPLSRDREGSQIVYYKPALTQKGGKAEEFCLSIFYLLQHCILDPLTQRRGFIFICDLRNTKMLQLDRRLVKSIVDMLSNKFPARLKKVLLLEPPGFFNMAFRVVRPLIPSKYLEKIGTARLADLQAYADTSFLLSEYGGTLNFDLGSYVDQLYLEETHQQQPQVSYPQYTMPPANKLDDYTINVAPQIGAAAF